MSHPGPFLSSGNNRAYSSGECFTCDGGYDNSQDSNLCATTEARYYSLAGSNDRKACTGKPNNSSWTSTTTGLSSVAGCSTLNWVCDGGFDNSQNANLCEATEAGYYSPAGSSDRTTCTDINKPGDSSWSSTTGLASFRGCWTCDAGYYKSVIENACLQTNIAIAVGYDHTCTILAGQVRQVLGG